MLGKLKEWIFGKVIFSKVIGKFVKHGSGAIVGLLFGDKVPFVKPALEAMQLSEGQVEAGLVVFLTGLFGAIWNYIEHRVVKK